MNVLLFLIPISIILLLIGIDMVQARRPATNETASEASDGCQKEDIGIVPLGMPMLAGPGAISTVMVLIGTARTPLKFSLVVLALALILQLFTAVFAMRSSREAR